MTMNQIEISEVTKNYSGFLALDKISLQVPKQSIYGLLGPNGAGKTTLIRILNQITAPDSGTITINGEPLRREHISKIGYLPEERGLYKKMKVGEQAIYLAQLKGLSQNEATKRLKEWFDRFEITQWWDKKVEELSKGMQQKIQFITTIIHEPEILILDEPFSGFDPVNANLLKETILELREKGATILLSTHNMASVEEMCDSITLINHGKKILEGRVDDIKHNEGISKSEITFTADEKTALDISQQFNVNIEHCNDHYSILIPQNNDNWGLVHHIIDMAHLISYKEVLPTMNEIFISKVKPENNEQ